MRCKLCLLKIIKNTLLFLCKQLNTGCNIALAKSQITIIGAMEETISIVVNYRLVTKLFYYLMSILLSC